MDSHKLVSLTERYAQTIKKLEGLENEVRICRNYADILLSDIARLAGFDQNGERPIVRRKK